MAPPAVQWDGRSVLRPYGLDRPTSVSHHRGEDGPLGGSSGGSGVVCSLVQRGVLCSPEARRCRGEQERRGSRGYEVTSVLPRRADPPATTGE